jgi:hypothetical protein
MKKSLDALSTDLKQLHKYVLEKERLILERSTRRTIEPLEFYKILLNDPSLAWLGPFLSLIARLDTIVDESETVSQEEYTRARFEVEKLFAEPKIQERLSLYSQSDINFKRIYDSVLKALSIGSLQ